MIISKFSRNWAHKILLKVTWTEFFKMNFRILDYLKDYVILATFPGEV